MHSKLLPVAVAILIHENKVLLLKRNKEPYKNLWSIPAGKVEFGEHVSDAALRELEEETGVKAKFIEHIGFVSEHLIENSEVTFQMMLHLCHVQAENHDLIESEEGELRWFNLDTFNQLDGKMIPSDFLMIEEIFKKRQKGYYNCVVEKVGNMHHLRHFS